MLLKKYALTIYFGRPFAIFDTPRLMYWLGKCNNLKGEMDLIETRYFAKDHENPKRRGARIVAFEGNQEFLDSLHAFPKDFPFNIRFGGNVYIRGGDRYGNKNIINHLPNTYLILNTKLTCPLTLLILTYLIDVTPMTPTQPEAIGPALTENRSENSWEEYAKASWTWPTVKRTSCLLYTSPSPRD